MGGDSGSTWKLQETIIDPAGSNSQDMFGDALAISPTTLVVGASCENSNSGAAYIYQRSGTLWDLQASMLDPLGGAADDSYGGSVAVSGDTVLISDKNTAYVYTKKAGQGWPQTGVLTNPGPATDNFGYSVGLSGTTAVVGAPEYSGVGPGVAYVFTSTGTTWSEQQALTAPSGTKGGEFGWSVAMINTAILVGMPRYGTNACGAGFAFSQSGGTWGVTGKQVDPGCTGNEQFGFAVSLSGTTGAYGAPFTNSSQGAAYELAIP